MAFFSRVFSFDWSSSDLCSIVVDVLRQGELLLDPFSISV